MTDRESTLLDGRIKRIEHILGRTLGAPPEPPQPPLSEPQRDHMREAAEHLYWDELEWEKLMEEEQLDEEFLAEMVFPGFLAFVRGLLLSEAMPDSLAPPRPSPEVVQDILNFLGNRVVELDEQSSATDGEDRDHKVIELKMTSRLIDLVLYLLHGFGPEDVKRVEASLAAE